MSFQRNLLAAAMATAFCAASATALAQSNGAQSGLTPNPAPDVYSSPDKAATGTNAGSSASSAPDGTAASTSNSSDTSINGATLDQQNRATSQSNAPADRIPANRGDSGDTNSVPGAGASSGSSVDNSSAAHANSLYRGNEDARAATSGMTHGSTSSSDDATAGSAQQGQPVGVYRRETRILLAPVQNNPQSTSSSDKGQLQGGGSSTDAQQGAEQGGSASAQGHGPVEIIRQESGVIVAPRSSQSAASQGSDAGASGLNGSGSTQGAGSANGSASSNDSTSSNGTAGSSGMSGNMSSSGGDSGNATSPSGSSAGSTTATPQGSAGTGTSQ